MRVRTMETLRRSKLFAGLLCLVIGFLFGRFQGPEKVEIVEKSVDQSELIRDLQSRIESLKKENLRENVRTVVVEKPDGTRVTTRTRETEKTTSETKLSDKKESSEESKLSSREKKTIETFSSKRNSFGVRGSYKLFTEIDGEVYLRAGMACAFLDCYVQGSYFIRSKSPAVAVGIEYRF